MRKVILGLAVSLDGFIEGPKGEYDWCLPPDKDEMTAFMNRVDALFTGRKTYEMAAGHGGGKPLFQNIKNRVGLTLIDSKVNPSGYVSLTYRK